MSESIRLPVLLIGLLLCSAAAAEDLVGKMGDVELHSSELKAILDAQPPDAPDAGTSGPGRIDRTTHC